MPHQNFKPIPLGSPLDGWSIQARWEHFGDPAGPGDLIIDWRHRYDCTWTEAERGELLKLGRTCAGNYPTRALAKTCLNAAIMAWNTDHAVDAAVARS